MTPNMERTICGFTVLNLNCFFFSLEEFVLDNFVHEIS